MVSIQQIKELDDVTFIDVRSPKEYKEGTIPGAINIPLLDDLERAKVGTIYKQECPQKAINIGKEIVTPKLPDILTKLKFIEKNNNNLVLFCWRGGLRSQSLNDFCRENGINTYFLSGGYKAYRKLVYSFLADINNIPDLAVLMGLTGVGKTRLLAILASLYKLSIIDIERLVNNRGSVFGQVHGGVQPSQKDFEANLYELIVRNRYNISVIECESKRVGRLFLPENLFKKMQTGIKIHLYASFDVRIVRVIEDYGNFPKEKLIEAVMHLKKYLGRDKVGYLIDLINKDNLEDVVSILLKDYYDPLYGYPKDKSLSGFDISVNCDDLNKAAYQVNKYLAEKMKKLHTESKFYKTKEWECGFI